MTKEERKKFIEENKIEGPIADKAQWFDALFTFGSGVYGFVAIVHLVAEIAGYDLPTGRDWIDFAIFSMVLWIASCQLAPYWNRTAPGYNPKQEGL